MTTKNKIGWALAVAFIVSFIGSACVYGGVAETIIALVGSLLLFGVIALIIYLILS
jgi:hypothetical protein